MLKHTKLVNIDSFYHSKQERDLEYLRLKKSLDSYNSLSFIEKLFDKTELSIGKTAKTIVKPKYIKEVTLEQNKEYYIIHIRIAQTISNRGGNRK